MQYELLKLPSYKTPLMYPGGKRKLWKTFEKYIPSGTAEMVSPFIGGGAIELLCTTKNIKVQASDNNEQLVNFWQQFINDPRRVVKKTNELYPLSFDERTHYYFNQLKKGCTDLSLNKLSNLDRAAVYWCMNKQSFRGWGLRSNPSEAYKKVSDEYFSTYSDWKNNKITVICSDYEQVVQNANGTFMYLDPPYVGKEHFYSDQRERRSRGVFDHDRLAELLHETDSKWILSYGEHPDILNLYSDYNIVRPKWKYTNTFGKDSYSQELLILNI